MKTIKNKMLFIGILLLISILAVNIVSASPFYYKISMDYDKGEVSIKDISVIYSQDDLRDNYGDYKADIIDINKNKIDSQNFVVPNIRFYDNGENGTITSGGSIVLDKVSFEIYAPYYADAKEIIISNVSKELTRTDVSMFSKIGELSLDNKEENIDSSKNSLEKKQETDTTRKSSNITDIINNIGNYWWVLLIILAVLVVILVYPRKKRK